MEVARSSFSKTIFQSRNWLVGFFVLHVFALIAGAQQCRTAQLCRGSGQPGELLFKPNSAGHKIYTSSCGPNTAAPFTDQLCHQITSCRAAGGFGKFLQAVTDGCREKHFADYFGLDGMTFGILHWTSGALPPLFEYYEHRDKAGYDEAIKQLDLKTTNNCVDSADLCRKNQTGGLMCDGSFHDTFKSLVQSENFQKAEIDYALALYRQRTERYSQLGLKTEYGNVAMAVVGNNLVPKAACRPEAWKKICSEKQPEEKMVQCMLDQYVVNSCRGSRAGSEARRTSINKAFDGGLAEEKVIPAAATVIACSTAWSH